MTEKETKKNINISEPADKNTSKYNNFKLQYWLTDETSSQTSMALIVVCSVTLFSISDGPIANHYRG